jgi:uncharacterized protein
MNEVKLNEATLNEVTLADVEAISIGAGVLGTGGGGNTYLGKIWLTRELRLRGGCVRIIQADEVADDDFLCSLSIMGAPTVSNEKPPQGDELVNIVRALEHHTHEKVRAIIIGEIGGSNGIKPLIAGLQLGLPVIDGDAMGRAFPELQMDMFSIGGVPHHPMALGDTHGNVVIFHQLDNAFRAEQYGRTLTIDMGGSAALAMPVMHGLEMKKYLIRNTLSLSKKIGDLILSARKRNTEPSDEVAELCKGRVLFRGKISDVERRTVKGFARGRMTLTAFGDPIVFQNENLVAWHNGNIVATVPDLITILSLEDGEPIGTEMLRYGLRVAVLGMPAPKELKTKEALEIVGPKAFGYPEITFVPMPGNLL